MDRTRPHAWTIAFIGVTVLIAVQRLVALGTIPQGLYSDEASIGYNAWAIAHHGVDEHGASFPLFFEAFGEYKSPLYIYLLAPFTWFLPLTAATERLVAALCGIAVCLLVAATAYRLTRSRPVAMLTLLTAALTPWAVIEARVGVEAPTMVLCLALALWCVVRGSASGASTRWMWGAGIALALGVYSYSSARLLVGAFVLTLMVVDRRWRSTRVVVPVLLPVAVAYSVLAGYTIAHPGALTHRLAGISIQSDEPGVLALVGRFVRNYLTYTGVPFLATRGDAALRYSTGYGGMFLVTTLPAIAVGVAVCIARRAELVPRLILVGLVLGPIPAALTNDDTPQALRASGILPFALLAAAYGWEVILPWLLRLRPALVVLSAVAAVEVGGFLIDLDTRYPNRALSAFDTGELTAVSDASALKGDHRVLLSTSLDQVYIEALFALRGNPPSAVFHPETDADNRAYHDTVLRPLNMAEAAAGEMTGLASSGDLLVLAPDDAPPAGATVLERVVATIREGEVFPVGSPPTQTQVLAVIWRR